MAGEAFYRLSARILSRSKGNTLVGYAAYLAAENLQDERYGETRYCQRQRFQERLFATEIVAPNGAPEWVYDRQQLHNRIEAAERRKDSQLAREVILSFPTQLDAQARREVTRQFIREQYVARGMVADISYHNFVGDGSHNPHAHVLITMRRLEEDGFAKTKEAQWQPKFTRKDKGTKAAGDLLAVERKQWEQYLNQALAGAGIEERVDCRSLSERGIDRLPEPKKGRAANMEFRPEWEDRTRAMDAWREVKEINELKAAERQTKEEIAELERQIAQLHLQEFIAESSKAI
ncbi:MobA/MobL family protein [Myxosarcina sp. GI1(2024)]